MTSNYILNDRAVLKDYNASTIGIISYEDLRDQEIARADREHIDTLFYGFSIR